MAETIILDPTAVATGRTQLDITAWIDVDGVDWGDAQITAYQAEGERGSVPVDFTIPNRTIAIPLNIRTVGATTFDSFRQSLQAKAALFQREGGWLSRQTSIGTLYMDVVNATLRLGGDWLQAFKSVDVNAVLTLECRPDFYGAEITLDDIVETTAAEIVTKLKLSAADAVIKGDYPGRVRIVVDEDEAQSQLGLLWGFRSRHYSSATTAALRYEAEALTPLDAAAIATVTGASGGGSNNVIQHTSLITSWTPVVSTTILSGTASMTHTGTYRVRARVYSTSTTPPDVRFVWDVGDLTYPVENDVWTIPGASRFCVADLGEIRLDPSPAGTHRWQGMIQAKGAAGGENVSIDKVWFLPLDESAGELRAPTAIAPGLSAYVARDGFDQSVGALAAKTLPVGGTWTGAGDAHDFAVETTGHTAQRTAAAADTATVGRYAIAGSTNYASTAAQVDLKDGNGGPNERAGVFARYTDANNWLMATVTSTGGVTGQDGTLEVRKRVAGTITTLTTLLVGYPFAYHTLRLVALPSGYWAVWYGEQGFPLSQPLAEGYDAILVTGGTLASGKPGFYAETLGSELHNFDNFAVWQPAADAVLHASQSAELRTEGIFREDSTGVAYGPVSWVIGDLPRVPPSGVEARPVELFLKATRGDLDQLPDSGIDNISARVTYRPSWLHVPGT